MRLKLYEDAIRAKTQKKKAGRNSRGSPTPQDELTDADTEAVPPGVTGGGDLASMVEAMRQGSSSEAGSRSSKHGKSSKPSVASVESHGTKEGLDLLDKLTASATLARIKIVQKVLEGLCEEAFEQTRDIGVDVLTQPCGLRKFADKLRDVVFPTASEEARELCKTGQKPGFPARQSQESMLSYVSSLDDDSRWQHRVIRTDESRTPVRTHRSDTSGDHRHQGLCS